ncbi:Ig-like domain-containing protein [Candidatus Palauibacter sp.]|uniref:Ig-like domain-containing protein n=1 Tax=Candidatus Palauibacter sp. TaxID=3101350 RepID=UPI003B0242CB
MNTRTSIKPILQRAGERRYRHLLRASLLLVFLGGIASCGGDGTTDPPPPPPPPPPVAPVAVGSIPAQVMIVGQSVTVDVSPFFSDPDGGTLTYAATSSDAGVVSVSLSGNDLTATAVAAGTATVTVTATDPDGLTATQSAGVTVEAANQAPEAVGAIPPQTITAGQTVTVDVSSFFSDPDGDELTYAAESSDAAVLTASVSGSSLTVTAVAAGTATVTVTAADPDGLTATQSAEVTVEAANQAPEAVGTIPPQAMTAGDEVTVDVSSFFSDPDGDELTYTAESSDAAVLTASTSGSSLTVTAVSAGTATVTVTAADPGGLTATQSAEVTVEAANQAPEAVGTIPARAMTAGDEVTVDVSSFFSDPDGDELTYTAESSDAEVAAAGIEGSSLTVTAVAVGTATVTVTAADPEGLTATQSAAVAVGQANQAPEALGTIPSQTLTEGDAVTLDVSSFFSDPEGEELTYTAESSDADAVTAGMEGSSLTVTAVAVGTVTVTVTAADPEGLTATQSAEVTVEAANQAPEAVGAIPARAMTEGDEVVVDVSPFFSDPDGDELTYTAESSDAAVAAAGIEGSSLTVTAVAEGSATVTVTAADPDGLTAAQSAEVTVEARAGFRDDFDSDASLDDWDIFGVAVEVVDGVLHLTGDEAGFVGSLDRVLETPVTEWALGTRMARSAAGERTWMYWVTGHDRFSRFRLVTGTLADGENYQLSYYDEQAPGYGTIARFHGNSDAIGEEAGEFTDITFSSQNGEFVLVAGETELFTLEISGTILGVPVSDMVGGVEEVWLAAAGDETILYDWVDLAGTEVGGRMADRPEAPGIGSLRRTKDLDPARLDIPTEVISLKKGR